ncbi:SDR family oxidoreductase [Thiothrix nivea]|uniref:Short-chain dehydrogenase/reductase SDR n=1 Tax=Thiothrix nivea (strain ATCC 35100 / DSM 5205 / JP2) TaxID=870187 RepID=A0A656HD10_THINJ|nr:NAD(P)-dependent oxidoreductase [Thiothrix nivea]EIJ34307.1 short-chain dehydrogenase/reductase SDR [Thiothrix nivea DSM 5205]
METLQGKTLFITGGSRGIGLAIALKAASEGANIVIAAKTAEPHPKLPGTLYTAAAEIEAAGGKALPIKADIRDEGQIADAVEQAVTAFGGIDILINNASAINLTGTLETPMKRYDLMQQVNARGTFAVSQACLPHLLKAPNPHILTLSPPLSMNPQWFRQHLAYTIAKYGMSMCVLGMAEEFSGRVAVNALWPRTVILTAAIRMLDGLVKPEMCRHPEIVADAACLILKQDAKQHTGNFYIDEEVLAAAGREDFGQYAVSPGSRLLIDLFLEDTHMRP